MPIKKKVSKGVSKVFDQARASLKLLESLAPVNRAGLTNEKILSSLKKIGVASAEDVESLRIRIETLEAQLANLSATRADSSVSANRASAAIPRG